MGFSAGASGGRYHELECVTSTHFPGGKNVKKRGTNTGGTSFRGGKSDPAHLSRGPASKHEPSLEEVPGTPRPETILARTNWLSIPDAVAFHYQRTPRLRPINRSAIYRWLQSEEHPVCGQRFGGELFVDRESLERFCLSGHPPRRRRKASQTTSDARYTAAVLDRIRRKHGIVTDTNGGEAG